jgi:hypothetical protein
VQLHQVEQHQRGHREEEVHDQKGIGCPRDQVQREQDEEWEVADLEFLHLLGQLDAHRVVLGHHWRLLGHIIEVQRAVLSLRPLRLLLPVALSLLVLAGLLLERVEQLFDHLHDDDDEEEKDDEEAEEDSTALAVLALSACHNLN